MLLKDFLTSYTDQSLKKKLTLLKETYTTKFITFNLLSLQRIFFLYFFLVILKHFLYNDHIYTKRRPFNLQDGKYKLERFLSYSSIFRSKIKDGKTPISAA